MVNLSVATLSEAGKVAPQVHALIDKRHMPLHSVAVAVSICRKYRVCTLYTPCTQSQQDINSSSSLGIMAY